MEAVPAAVRSLMAAARQEAAVPHPVFQGRRGGPHRHTPVIPLQEGVVSPGEVPHLHTEALQMVDLHIDRLHTGNLLLPPIAAEVLLLPIVAGVPLPHTAAGAAVPHITGARLPRPAITDHRAVADHMEAVPTVEVVPMAAVLMAEAAAAVDHAVAGKTFSNRTEI